ncbi:Protein of unknown function [Propionibacterium freudenreichii]|nr:Protein of unknown function [Propionibacterium freudenreichii]
MVEHLHVGTLEEPQSERPTRREDPCELCEHLGDIVWFQMDQRVPGKNACHALIRDVEMRCLTDTERHVGRSTARGVDELGHRINALDIAALLVKPVRPVPRSAADIEDAARNPASPGANQRAILQCSGLHRAELIDVLDGTTPIRSTHLTGSHPSNCTSPHHRPLGANHRKGARGAPDRREPASHTVRSTHRDRH